MKHLRSFRSTSMEHINPVTTSGAERIPPENSDGTQLSRLGSVLNGLEHGTARMCGHVQSAMRAVHSGTYRVDAMKLSRRIVGEAMGTA